MVDFNQAITIEHILWVIVIIVLYSTLITLLYQSIIDIFLPDTKEMIKDFKNYLRNR